MRMILLALMALCLCGAAECTGEECDVDFDGDGYCYGDGAEDDCDDEAADVNPGEEERCDGVDNDCDGEMGRFASETIPNAEFGEIDQDEDGILDCEDVEPGVPN